MAERIKNADRLNRISKAVKSMTPLWEDFIRLGPVASLGIRLPSGEVEMSRALLSVLRLSPDARPRTLDQWRELCHPADHHQMQELDRALADEWGEVLSLTRRLYCGDGVYRLFRLEACLQRSEDGSPQYLMGIEALLEKGQTEGTDQEPYLQVPDMPLRYVRALEEENLVLRRALQRQALHLLAQPPAAPAVGKRITLSVLGLAGSGGWELMRVLREDGLLPEGLALTETPGEGDIVLYIIPLRGHLKSADADLLTAAARRGQRIIVLLTMTDLERDEAEAGRVLLSRQQRVERALRELREELKRASIPPCPLIPLSPHLAWRGLYDRASTVWRESNFDELLRLIAPTRSSVPGTLAPRGEEPPREAGAEPPFGLFDALLFSLREQALRTRFLALPVIKQPSDARWERFSTPRKLVMMGLNRQEALRLVSRLAHNSSLFDEETEARSWLFFGRGEPPFPREERLPTVPCVCRPEALAGFDILVAPENAFNPGGMEWEDLFAQWTPVVHMDLVRVDSSLSELARTPWFSALASAPRWVLAFAHSGLFDTRLSGLLEAEERVMRFAVLRGFQGRMSPFVYENYDPRYTDFLELGARVRYDATADDLSALVAGWGRDELDYAPPFTRDQLAIALLVIRSKLQRIRQKIVK